MKRPRVLVIGLDCAPPRFVFDEWQKYLPTLSKLIAQSYFGPLRSSDPPITIPAWTSMLSGKTPAELSFYGFKTRKGSHYFEHELLTSQAVRHPRVWDILGRQGKRSILLGVPQTFPAFPINGCLVSCFLTPSLESDCTYPAELKNELREICPDYMFDIPHFRTERKQEILTAASKSLSDHFRFFSHLLKTRDWDFAMMVEMGTDRIQHCFWSDWDESHPLHNPQSPFKNAMLEFYRLIDHHLADLLEMIDLEETYVFILSDHGAKAMQGAIALNEWLIQKGYLVLCETPPPSTPVSQCKVDWAKTRAWAEGGYYGRLYLNVKDREAEGVLAAEECATFLKQIRREIEAIRGNEGKILQTKTYTSEELYGFHEANAPDLFIYFDDLNYRCLGSVGTGRVNHLQNDQGPDGANHDYNGIFILRGPDVPSSGGPVSGMRLIDVARTILSCFDIYPPEEVMGGRNIFQRFKKQAVLS